MAHCVAKLLGYGSRRTNTGWGDISWRKFFFYLTSSWEGEKAVKRAEKWPLRMPKRRP